MQKKHGNTKKNVLKDKYHSNWSGFYLAEKKEVAENEMGYPEDDSPENMYVHELKFTIENIRIIKCPMSNFPNDKIKTLKAEIKCLLNLNDLKEEKLDELTVIQIIEKKGEDCIFNCLLNLDNDQEYILPFSMVKKLELVKTYVYEKTKDSWICQEDC